MPSPTPAPPLTDDQAALVRRLWDEGVDQDTIARTVGRSKSSLFDRSRAARGRGHLAHPSLEHLPRRRGQGGGRRVGPDFHVERFDKPDEIEARRDAIKAAWTPEERAARRWPGPPEDRREGRARTGFDNFAPARGFVSSRVPHRRTW